MTDYYNRPISNINCVVGPAYHHTALGCSGQTQLQNPCNQHHHTWEGGRSMTFVWRSLHLHMWWSMETTRTMETSHRWLQVQMKYSYIYVYIYITSQCRAFNTQYACPDNLSLIPYLILNSPIYAPFCIF